MDEEGQVERALRIHKNIEPHLASSSIIRKQPSRNPSEVKIIFPPQSEEDKQAEKELVKWYQERLKRKHPNLISGDEVFDLGAARDLSGWGIPIYKSTKTEAFFQLEAEHMENEKWVASPHHGSLMDLLSRGIIPDDQGQDVSSHSRTLNQAYSLAIQQGYKIPEKYFTHPKASYGEEEAFYAARRIFGSGRVDQINLKLYGSHICVRSLVSNFPVPNPNNPFGPPFFIDQLWIVLTGGPAVRLLAIEIDGEHHLQPEQQKHDAIRDEILTDLGYEVWRVGGWWCRVDAWRAIVEVLVKAGILPDAESYLGESSLGDINTYVCDICDQPMVRWDTDWIKEYRDGKAHRMCWSEIYE